MNRDDLPKAQAKMEDLMGIIKSTPTEERQEISWDELTKLRLKILKEPTWENAVRQALINFCQKENAEENPFLPEPVLTFLRS